MNISAKFQLYRPYSFSEVFFKNIFSLSVAMTTNEIVGLRQIFMFGRGPLNKHF